MAADERPLPSVDELNTWSPGTFPGLLGIVLIALERERITAELALRPELLAPNGYLHAGVIVSLADTTCGYGARAHLPEGARGFTTIELKSNFLGTATEGMLDCVATLLHGGRTTQVWDAVVRERASGRELAHFRCTQLVLYPR